MYMCTDCCVCVFVAIWYLAVMDIVRLCDYCFQLDRFGIIALWVLFNNPEREGERERKRE